MTTFGNRLQELRKEKGYTLDELANKFNKSKSTFSSYENDRRKPDIELVADLADFFNVSSDYLLGKTDHRFDPADRLQKAVEDDPELASFVDDLVARDSLKLAFKQTRKLSDDAIKDVMRIIKRIEDEEDEMYD